MIHVDSVAALLTPRGQRKSGPSWRDEDPERWAVHLAHLMEYPHCAARSAQCRGPKQPHHVKPVHLFPELKLDRRNLVTLCKWHHDHLGHANDNHSWVPDVVRLAEECRVLGWTTPSVLQRAKASRSYTRDGAAFKGPAQVIRERIEAARVPARGASRSWVKRLVRRVLGTVLLCLLPLPLLGCKAGPGVRLTVSLTPLPVVTVQVGGGDLAVPAGVAPVGTPSPSSNAPTDPPQDPAKEKEDEDDGKEVPR